MYSSLSDAVIYAKRFLDRYYRWDNQFSEQDIADSLMEDILDMLEDRDISLTQEEVQSLDSYADDNKKIDDLLTAKVGDYPTLLTQALKNYIFSCVDLDHSTTTE